MLTLVARTLPPPHAMQSLDTDSPAKGKDKDEGKRPTKSTSECGQDIAERPRKRVATKEAVECMHRIRDIMGSDDDSGQDWDGPWGNGDEADDY